MTQSMNLRRAADCLDIESWRILRLCRFLGIDAYEYAIPNSEVDRIASLDDPADRYCGLREWLLNHSSQPIAS